MELRREVSSELDRLESKRRAVASVESRLRSREEAGQVAEMEEASRQSPTPDPETMSRAEIRALRRAGGSA